MTVDYVAFRELNRPRYRRYARARTGDADAAERAVEGMLADLAVVWKEVLRSPSPAAAAWCLLGQNIEKCTRADTGSALHRVLRTELADTALLHLQLGVSLMDAADLMGVDVSVVRARLAVAEREFRPELAARYRMAWGGTVSRHMPG
ncbi:hypothetical protein ABTZ59_36340 [Streptomyces sp. NPDC094034]|uniref:hypothetical protein n=1 Tax=Streptomyces sp. NPDC094034 TaxID=3155309 RepID=UPI0033329E5C